MQSGSVFARILLLFGPVVAQQALCQTATNQQNPQSPAQVQPQQKRPLKPNEVDPNGKPNDLPDPTKDPTKDPATDVTRDQTKDPDATTVQGAGGADKLGADSAGVTPDAPDYTGPAILSRGYALTRPAVPKNEHLRFFVGINATYDSGLVGAYVKDSAIPSVTSVGADVNWGASAAYYRKKDIFQFNYSGHYYEYANGSSYNGQDHAFSGGYTRQFSPRLTAGIRETAGLYSNTYSVLNSTAIADTSLASGTIVVAPNTESFDDRTYYSTTSGSLTYQQSARLSFSVNGTYFLVRRASTDLADSTGYQTGADVNYRITRRQTLGLYYAHSGYSYRKIFGDSNADSVGLSYGVDLTRTMTLSIRAGGTRYDSQTLAVVTPNPLVQQVLGIHSGIEKFYFVGYSPDFTATLTRSLRRSSLGASFTEGITPGNGLVLTSKRQSESVFWSLPTFRSYATQFGAGRDILSGYTTGPQSYASYYLRFTASRPITPVISSYFNIDYRQFGFGGTTFHQKEYRISAGIRFSPGEGSMKLW